MNSAQFDREENAKYLLDLVSGWIKNIDQKTSYALTLTSLLLGLILNKGRPKVITTIESSGVRMNLIVGAAIVILLYLLVFLAVLMFLFTIACRIKQRGKKKSMIYFTAISGYKLSTYVSEYNKINNAVFVSQLLEQIHTNSKICSTKTKWYNRGIYLLGGSFALYIVSILFQLL